jgi:hypothetical protein
MNFESYLIEKYARSTKKDLRKFYAGPERIKSSGTVLDFWLKAMKLDISDWMRAVYWGVECGILITILGVGMIAPIKRGERLVQIPLIPSKSTTDSLIKSLTAYGSYNGEDVYIYDTTPPKIFIAV